MSDPVRKLCCWLLLNTSFMNDPQLNVLDIASVLPFYVPLTISWLDSMDTCEF